MADPNPVSAKGCILCIEVVVDRPVNTSRVPQDRRVGFDVESGVPDGSLKL